jgi:hypothetical protein
VKRIVVATVVFLGVENDVRLCLVPAGTTGLRFGFRFGLRFGLRFGSCGALMDALSGLLLAAARCQAQQGDGKQH